MTLRNRTILRLLSESTPQYTTIERIAEETGAGIRTIHRDLEGLERGLRLRGVRLERRRGYGIRLIDTLPESLIEGLREIRPTGGSDSGQRPMMVLLYLIIVGDWVKLSEIASTLYVSDSTISTDLNVLESWLPAQISLDRHKGMGIRLVSDEIPMRLLFLSSFPAMFPMYVINDDSSAENGGMSVEDRFMDGLNLRADRNLHKRKIETAEEMLGYHFSPASRGLLFSYLYLTNRRLNNNKVLCQLPMFRLEVPEVYSEAAIAMIATDLAGNTDSPDVVAAEIGMLARILSSCETTVPPESSVAEYMGSLAPQVEKMLEHSLSRLEEKEKIWLHDDRLLLNYVRLIIVAAARRIDLGISAWWELGLHTYPGIEETPESVVLVSQFLSDLGRILKEPSPAIVRREIQEASLAVGARLEAFRSRHNIELKVKILCYEGLGMTNYLLALARDVFPSGTVFDSKWERDFERNMKPELYDLIISTFPVRALNTRVLILKGDDVPDEIRRQIREVLRDFETSNIERNLKSSTELSAEESERTNTNNEEASYSLGVVMSVIKGFFVEQKSADIDLISQAIDALDRKDCDKQMMLLDFERRESYGSLVFEEMNTRILHCRTEGIPEPRAGVIQDISGDETVLVLSAPISAKQSQTHALSEIVIALTEYPDFPELLARGKRREIQARLMTLFGNKVG